jgi:hypothetical protein
VPRATTVVIALALGLASRSAVLAAPATGKPPDNPFDERGADTAAGAAETEPKQKNDDEQDKKPGAQTAKPSPSSSEDDESAAGESEQPGAGPGEEGGGEDEGEPESGLHALACLEGETADGKRKGVQRRDFLKRHRFELAAVGGYYASDALSSTYSYGGAVAFYPSEDFGVELLVTRTPIKFRLEEPFNAFDQERHFTPSAAFQGIASLLW